MESTPGTNLKDKSTWMRLVYIIIFAIAFYIAEILVAIITLVQFFSVLFTKAPNARLQSFGGDLGAYLREVTRFLTFQTDQMPYPVSDWQHAAEPEPVPEPAPKPQSKTTAKPATKRKPAARKATPRKKPGSGPAAKDG